MSVFEKKYRFEISAVRTIEASAFTMFMARWFGSSDSFCVRGHKVTVAVWGGKEYFLPPKKGVESV